MQKKESRESSEWEQGKKLQQGGIEDFEDPVLLSGGRRGRSVDNKYTVLEKAYGCVHWGFYKIFGFIGVLSLGIAACEGIFFCEGLAQVCETDEVLR